MPVELKPTWRLSLLGDQHEYLVADTILVGTSEVKKAVYYYQIYGLTIAVICTSDSLCKVFIHEGLYSSFGFWLSTPKYTYQMPASKLEDHLNRWLIAYIETHTK